MNTTQTRYLWMVVAALMLFMLGGVTDVPVDPPHPETPADPNAARMIFVIYETLDGKPAQSQLAVEELRSQGHQARFSDDDAETADGQTPAELEPAIEPARQAGLPALVVTIGKKVVLAKHIPTEKDPGGEAKAEEIIKWVLEAIK
jgi:hypothetical protein